MAARKRGAVAMFRLHRVFSSKRGTCTPTCLDLRPRRSLAMHFGTFRLTDEGIDFGEHWRRLALLKRNSMSSRLGKPAHIRHLEDATSRRCCRIKRTHGTETDRHRGAGYVAYLTSWTRTLMPSQIGGGAATGATGRANEVRRTSAKSGAVRAAVVGGFAAWREEPGG